MLCARYLRKDSHRNLLLFSQFQSRKKLLLSFLCAHGVGEMLSHVCSCQGQRSASGVSLHGSPLYFCRQGLSLHMELASLEPGWQASTQNPFLCSPVQPPGLHTPPKHWPTTALVHTVERGTRHLSWYVSWKTVCLPGRGHRELLRSLEASSACRVLMAKVIACFGRYV